MANSQQNESTDSMTSTSSSVRILTRRLYLYPVLGMLMTGYVLSEYYAYGSFGRALMFQPNDQPGAPFEIRATVHF